MGLVQRVLEQAGVATISLSPIPAFTAATGAPRVAAIAHPLAQTVGAPGDVQGQRAVLRATLTALESITEPGSVVDLPFAWPGSPRRARSHPRKLPPIAQLIKRKPWLMLKLLAGEVPPPPA